MNSAMGPTVMESAKASEIIKKKLEEQGGAVTVYTARKLPCEIRAAADGVSFLCNKLPVNPPYRYWIFDVMIECLAAQGGQARKGNGRNFKLGEPNCDETTVVGAIGYQYTGRKTGQSVYDPVFVLAAILEWAGLAHNERGRLRLTAEYQSKCLFHS